MGYRNADPTDTEIAALLDAIPPDGWAGLWQAVDELGDVQSTTSELVHWEGGDRVGATVAGRVEAPVDQKHYAVYSDPLNRLVRQLYELRLVTSLNWPEWDGTERYRAGRGLDTAPLADAVRLITAVVRSDRFCDGAIAVAIEDGTLPAALSRLRAQYDPPPAPGSRPTHR
jgi:uncharacterized linocin/CFP29 family protein